MSEETEGRVPLRRLKKDPGPMALVLLRLLGKGEQGKGEFSSSI